MMGAGYMARGRWTFHSSFILGERHNGQKRTERLKQLSGNYNDDELQ